MGNNSRPSLFRDEREIVPLVEFESFRLSDGDDILRLCVEEFRARYGSQCHDILDVLGLVLSDPASLHPLVSSFWRLYPLSKSAWLWLGFSVVLGSELSFNTLLGRPSKWCAA